MKSDPLEVFQIPPDKDPRQVAAYIRWSTDDQATGTTFEVQRDSCLDYARRRGWVVTEENVFVDGGYSGATLERPALDMLRQKIRAGQIDCLVVAAIDRLSRNLIDVISLVHEEWNGKCQLVSVRDKIDPSTEFGRLQFATLAIFAQQERAFIRERTQSGRVASMRSGKKAATRPPFGYIRKKAGVWEEHPTEGPVVKRIFELAAEGVTVHSVVSILRHEGATDRNGRELTPPTVYRILKNRAYLGELIWGSFKTSATPTLGVPLDVPGGSIAARLPRRRTNKIKSAQPLIHVKSEAVPQLITQDLFDRANQWLTERTSHGARRLKHPAGHRLLIGLAKCKCGRSLGYYERVQRGEPQAYYRCTWRHSNGSPCPYGAGDIPFDEANVLVSFLCLALFGRFTSWNSRILRHIEQTLATQRSHIVTAEAQARTIEQKLKSLVTRAFERRITLKDVARERTRLDEERQAILHDLTLLTGRYAALEHSVQALQRTADTADRWEELPVDGRQRILRSVLTERVVVFRPTGADTIQIECPWLYTEAP